MKSYHASIAVPVSRHLAFDAVANRISEWWGRDLEGRSAKLNDVFTIHFGKTFGRFRISEFIADEKIVWDCIDNYLDIFNDKTQWKGTKLIWEFFDAKEGSTIEMTHDGLTPAIECYEDCIKGWDFYVKESLYGLLAKSKGLPGVGIRANVFVNGRLYEGTMYSKEDRIPELVDGSVLIDIRERKGETIVSANDVGILNVNRFKPEDIAGDYYMVVDNAPRYEGESPFKDLKRLQGFK